MLSTVVLSNENQTCRGWEAPTIGGEDVTGLSDKYIEGIFVSDEVQSHGIGKLLLDYVKDRKAKLSLNVYQKNTRAIHFYQREGFKIQQEGLDEATGEKEYVMLWKPK